MTEDDSVFICKACTNNSRSYKIQCWSFVLKKCYFKAAFKYNLKRHIDNMHDGNDVTDQTVAEIQEEPPVVDCPPPLYVQRTVDLKDVLKDLDLDSLLRNFESEGVDLDLLITAGYRGQ